MTKELTELICPTCGATNKEKEFINFFCTDCYHIRHKVQVPYTIPEEIVIKQCKHCGIYKIRRWYNTLRETMIDIPHMFKGSVSDVKVISLSERLAVVEFVLEEEKTTKEIPARIHKTLCNNCIKIARGYFEAIVQIRGEKEWVEMMKERYERALTNTFITKVKEWRFGVDLYIGSTKSAVGALKALGLKIKKSNRLHTEKAGKKLYRMTYLIRQPETEERKEENNEEQEE
jgi:nonsense-mediated mRNA decay protein 3